MANTPNHGLNKQDAGTLNWHTVLNSNYDEIDARLPRSYAGNPNTNVAGLYIGQPIFSSTEGRLYHCTTTGNAASAVWTALVNIPAGLIAVWSGTIATIPAGWALCDGNNGTPNLVDKFVIGAKEDNAGAAKTNVTGALTISGGAASVNSGAAGAHDHGGVTGATAAPLPAHSHGAGSLAAASGGSHTHTTATGASGSFQTTMSAGPGYPSAAQASAGTVTSSSDGAHSHTISGTTASEGAGGTHTHTIAAAENHQHTVATLPPYYALAFIMKTA